MSTRGERDQRLVNVDQYEIFSDQVIQKRIKNFEIGSIIFVLYLFSLKNHISLNKNPGILVEYV